jgi:hypothetical protein
VASFTAYATRPGASRIIYSSARAFRRPRERSLRTKVDRGHTVRYAEMPEPTHSAAVCLTLTHWCALAVGRTEVAAHSNNQGVAYLGSDADLIGCAASNSAAKISENGALW